MDNKDSQSPPPQSETKNESLTHIIIRDELEAAQNFFTLHPDLYARATNHLDELKVYKENNHISPEQFDTFMKYLLAQAEYARMNSELTAREAQEATKIDQLTKLPNKDSFNLHIKEMIEQLKNNPTPDRLLLSFADMDNFGSYNRSFGQEEGDKAIKEFADQVKGLSRDTDMVGRVGGDEFGILQVISRKSDPNATSELISPSERIRSQMRVGKEDINISATFGSAYYQEGDTFESLYNRANAANSLAKLLGRNRTVLASYTPNGTIFSDQTIDENSHRVGHDYTLEINGGTVLAAKDIDSNIDYKVIISDIEKGKKPSLVQITTNG